MKKIILFSSFLVLFSVAHAGLYRWVDETGKVHYSDKMPVAASKKAHSELTENGVVKKTIDPEATIKLANKNQEELSLLEQEKKRQEKIKQEQQELTAKKEKRDKFLLSTYDDESELIHFFEDKIKRLEGNSNILKAQSNVLHKKIIKLESTSSDIENKESRKLINKKIVQIKSNIKQYEKALKENGQEIISINLVYQNDYKRFSELSK